MNVSGLIDQLTEQGVQVWADDNGKLKIQSPKGVMTSELQSELVARKAEILEFLLNPSPPSSNTCGSANHGLSMLTLGRLIGGYGRGESFTPPVIDPTVMAQQLKVTFRPLPANYKNETIIKFRQDLEDKLTASGVTVVPWEAATQESEYEMTLPIINRQRTVKSTAVKAAINAMIDVERHPSLLGKLKVCVAENLYQFYSRFWLKDRKLSVSKIAQFISWAEENIHDLQDPTNTQVIVLTELDEKFINPELSYQKKIPIGVNTLVRTFSEIVVGVSESRLSILNMNLSDSVFPTALADGFVAQSLIPKIFVPIMPLSLSRFEIGTYNPEKSDYAAQLVKFGNALASTGLLPDGFKIDDVVKRQSHRDIVDWMAKGRTGVSYGFVAYAEPPQYVGDLEVSESTWTTLKSVAGFDADELRQNSAGRWYLRLRSLTGWKYQQVPDIWLVSSRSGSNKTKLHLATDIVRLGLTGNLQLQLPEGVDPNVTDVKPSYDLYVMVSLALGAALFAPKLIEKGMPMVHFHGYPAKEWFAADREYCAGVENPSVPCGTYESGAFNFLSIQRLVEQHGSDIRLASLVEPDHGTNVVADDMDYLLQRLVQGVGQKKIELGGRHYPSLKAMTAAS
ncbi:MAG: non-ribosomal peptide synthase [Leptolyngbya sp. SIOISBB]|nr:non-ribosomal peptide synthase [Leptolyngbya sp. SIOISBB]